MPRHLLHKISAKNTKVREHHDGSIVVTYFNTEIFRFSAREESVKVQTHGWCSGGMLTRINQAFNAFGLVYRMRTQLNSKTSSIELAIYNSVDKRVVVIEELVEDRVSLSAVLPVT